MEYRNFHKFRDIHSPNYRWARTHSAEWRELKSQYKCAPNSWLQSCRCPWFVKVWGRKCYTHRSRCPLLRTPYYPYLPCSNRLLLPLDRPEAPAEAEATLSVAYCFCTQQERNYAFQIKCLSGRANKVDAFLKVKTSAYCNVCYWHCKASEIHINIITLITLLLLLALQRKLETIVLVGGVRRSPTQALSSLEDSSDKWSA